MLWGAVDAILGILLKIITPLINMLGWLYGKLPFEIRRRKPKPKLGIIENSFKQHTWEIRRVNNEKYLSINTNWHITNTLPYNLTVLNTFLRKPERTKGMWMSKDTNSDYWGPYGIARNYTTDVTLSYLVDPKYIKDEDTAITVDVEIIDPVGNRHIVKNVKVVPAITKKRNSPETILPIENTNKIRGSLEKTLVAVLKDEIEQYKARGRPEGRLGSVEWPRGRIEWRTAGEQINFLNGDSSKEHIRSKNIDAIKVLYERSSEKDREVIVNALKKRLDKQLEYRDIGYFVVLALFELGFLPIGLKFSI